MTSHCERDNDYLHVLCQLSDHLRVIRCKDDLQWILQKRDGTRSGLPRWTGVSYFVTRAALIRACQSRCADTDELIDALSAAAKTEAAT